MCANQFNNSDNRESIEEKHIYSKFKYEHVIYADISVREESEWAWPHQMMWTYKCTIHRTYERETNECSNLHVSWWQYPIIKCRCCNCISHCVKMLDLWASFGKVLYEPICRSCSQVHRFTRMHFRIYTFRFTRTYNQKATYICPSRTFDESWIRFHFPFVPNTNGFWIHLRLRRWSTCVRCERFAIVNVRSIGERCHNILKVKSLA